MRRCFYLIHRPKDRVVEISRRENRKSSFENGLAGSGREKAETVTKSGEGELVKIKGQGVEGIQVEVRVTNPAEGCKGDLVKKVEQANGKHS